MERPLRLLVIEDQEDHALLLERELCKEMGNLAFERVETAQELESALAGAPWDAVICDFNLPGFNGINALRMVQARVGDIPFILVSGVIGEELAVESMKAGAHDFIVKGNYSRLVPALQRELREAEVRRERRKAEQELVRYREHLEELVQERTAQLKQAKDAAEAASRAKNEFLSNVSHEMRTPLTGIMGIIDLVLMGDLSEEEGHSYLEMAYKSAESLNRLINDILDFTSIASGKISFRLGCYNIGDCIRSAVDIFKLEAIGKGLQLLSEIGDNVPEEVRGDEGRIRQVLVNLVGNAVKFTDHGEISISVQRARDSARPEHEYLQFAVRDTGIGIPPECTEVIFEQFTQLDASTTRKYGGCGLGLAISKQIVEALGGRIWVESREGEGSVFMFTLVLAGEECNHGQNGMVTIQSKRDPEPPGELAKCRG